MANVWVGSEYYIPEIDQSGRTFDITIKSTTTSNTYVYQADKDVVPPNPESVGAAKIVFLKGFGYDELIEHPDSADDSRRIRISPDRTDSTNGKDLVVEYAVAANGCVSFIYDDNFDSVGAANAIPYHVVSGGTGWNSQDEIYFDNIDAGYYENEKRQANIPAFSEKTDAEKEAFFKAVDKENKPNQRNNVEGYVIWTDVDGPAFFNGTPEVNLASNATFYVNCAIRANTWIP